MHSHVLPGIDDGPGTIEGSIALARAAAAAGTSTLLATPHVSLSYPNTAAVIAGLVERVNEELRGEGVELEVVAGAEIALSGLIDIAPEELGRLGLGGSSWLLVEPPFSPAATGVESILMELVSRGHRVLLAHPERCPAFHRNPEVLAALVRAGVLTSITAGSLVGRFGGEVRRFSLGMVREELVHNVASDAHNLTSRPPGIATELERSGLEALAEWLTEQVPGAILADERIPPRPAVGLPALDPPRRSRWLRRRG